jgi:hypothetical protein
MTALLFLVVFIKIHTIHVNKIHVSSYLKYCSAINKKFCHIKRVTMATMRNPAAVLTHHVQIVFF